MLNVNNDTAKLGYPKPIISITNELEKLKRQGLEIDDNYLVKLNNKNSEIIEKNIIRENNHLNYIPFAKFIFMQIKYQFGDNYLDERDFYHIVIREIDRDNSTNVWRYGKKNGYQDFTDIVDFIYKNRKSFYERLKNGDTNLPDEIAHQPKSGNVYSSLGSKICKYMEEYIFGNDNPNYQNKYFINDQFVRHVLPYYQKEYKLNNQIKSNRNSNMLNYEKLHNYLDELLNYANKFDNCNLTRNQLDHILWFSYKSFN